ncbi:MAG: preprotein translocase subunit YajC [Microthrixaceae bacterium]|nr:preprotein translocase subunit YajC [Microthrixaceae bacterium]
MPQLLLTILLIAIGWFFLIRPQQARVREQRQMVANLTVGDQVITAGGIHGRITGLETETVLIELAPGVEVTLARAAVVRLLTNPAADGASGEARSDQRSEGIPMVNSDNKNEPDEGMERGVHS